MASWLVHGLTPWHVCRFAPRHNALSPQDEKEMCEVIGAKDMSDLMNSAIPDGLPRLDGLDLGIYTKGMSESEFLEHFKYVNSKHTPYFFIRSPSF